MFVLSIWHSSVDVIYKTNFCSFTKQFRLFEFVEIIQQEKLIDSLALLQFKNYNHFSKCVTVLIFKTRTTGRSS